MDRPGREWRKSTTSKNNLIESIAPNSVSNGASVTCSTNVSTSINAVYANRLHVRHHRRALLDITRKFTDPDLGNRRRSPSSNTAILLTQAE